MSPTLYWTLLAISCGYALVCGRKYERLAAIICVLASIVSVLLRAPLHERYLGVEAGDLLVDLAVLGAFVAIALQSDRFWPLWVAGLQLTTSFSHFLRAIDPNLIPQAYAAAERFWSYPILVILLIGAWRSHRRATAQRDQEALA
ncbi:MAG TPA: hypothetical protein VF067_07365 [Sphingomicrobium sp.]